MRARLDTCCRRPGASSSLSRSQFSRQRCQRRRDEGRPSCSCDGSCTVHSNRVAEYRIANQYKVEDLTQSLLLSFPDTFAGAFISQQGDGTVHFLSTKRIDLMTDAIASGMPDDIPFEVDLVQHGLIELAGISRKIDAALSPVVGVTTSVDIWTNTVGVALYKTAAERNTIQNALAESYGTAVSFEGSEGRESDPREEELACSIPTASVPMRCQPPTRGGVDIGNTRVCTLGFNVRSNSDGKPYILTAGHCLHDEGGAGATIKGFTPSGGSYTIGVVHNWFSTSTRDDGLVSVTNGASFGGNYLFVAVSIGPYPTTRNETYDLAPNASTSGALVGHYICKSGANGGTGCGVLQQVGYTNPRDG